MSDTPRCPRCGEGTLVHRELNQPARYSCGHEDFLADLPARIGLVMTE